VLINTACVTDAGGSMVMCDVVRWDRVTGNRSTVAVRGGREFVASDIADNGRVLVGRRPAYEATYSASDPGTPLRRVGVVYGGTSGHLSSDGEIFLADVHVTLCCRGVTALRVSDGTVLASRGVEWSGLPGIVAVQMTGDGRHLIETVLNYRPTANTTYADPYNTYEVEDLDGQPARALHANQVVWISTAGVTGIGADATTVVLNLTVVDPAHDGFLTVWPCGLSRPLASNVNFGAGTTVGSEVFAGVGSGGHVCVSSNVDVNVVIDAQGWFDTSSPYRPVVPFRLLDTRGADTSGTAHVVSGTEIVVPIAGVATIGADASSAVLSVIVTNPAAAGFLTVWPCGQTRPIASNVNFDVGETRANTVLATLGTDGRVCMASNADVDVVVDAQGWFPTPAPYRGGTPQRIADTRGGEVDAAANLAAGSRVVISARTGAAATMLNIAATNPAADGFATVWPCDQPQPFVSNLNFTAGETTANAVLAGAAADGTICIASSVDVDLIVDVQGDFDADAGYHSVAPFRLLDTRI